MGRFAALLSQVCDMASVKRLPSQGRGGVSPCMGFISSGPKGYGLVADLVIKGYQFWPFWY